MLDIRTSGGGGVGQSGHTRTWGEGGSIFGPKSSTYFMEAPYVKRVFSLTKLNFISFSYIVFHIHDMVINYCDAS